MTVYISCTINVISENVPCLLFYNYRWTRQRQGSIQHIYTFSHLYHFKLPPIDSSLSHLFIYWYFVCKLALVMKICEIQWNLSKPNLLGTNFCVQNREVFSLYRLNQQRYPTLGLSLKFGLHGISVYPGFGLDRIHCTTHLM